MKSKFFLLFLLLAIVKTVSQNRDENVNVGPEFKSLIDQLNECIHSKEEDCPELADRIIEKGIRENVPFLDYLYFKKAFYLFSRNETDATIVYALKALEHLHPEENQRTDVTTYNLLGSAYYRKGNLETSLNYFLKIAAILENSDDKLKLGYLYSNIATILGETNNNEKQLEYLLKSYNLLEENNETRYIATVASNLGLCYYHKKNRTQGYYWSEKALKLAEESQDLVAKTQSYLTLSFLEKDLKKSLEYAANSIKYADELKDKTHQSLAYYRYAEALNQLDEYENAAEYAEKAIKFASDTSDSITWGRASLTAGNIYYNLGRKEEASDFYRNYINSADAITSAESVREINELQIKYETEIKEKQLAEQELKIEKQKSNLVFAVFGGSFLIVLLGGSLFYHRKTQQLKLNQLQQEKEKAILNSFILGEERERNRISHELHDGVAAMIGAAKMSLESIPHLQEGKKMEQLNKVKNILKRTHADIRHIAHNLLPTVLEKEGLIEATKQFVSEINDTEIIKITVSDKQSDINNHSKQLQLMLFRVIQELVNNIIKHSQATQAHITFSDFQNGILIEVTDDGIGYDATEAENCGNQGLYSISQRIKSIGGNFKIIKKSKGGTKAMVKLNV